MFRALAALGRADESKALAATVLDDLLPRRWVVERSFGWMARFRRLARDFERLGETLDGVHYVAFSMLMLHKASPHFWWSS